jgi:hypothetical protein
MELWGRRIHRGDLDQLTPESRFANRSEGKMHFSPSRFEAIQCGKRERRHRLSNNHPSHG